MGGVVSLCVCVIVPGHGGTAEQTSAVACTLPVLRSLQESHRQDLLSRDAELEHTARATVDRYEALIQQMQTSHLAALDSQRVESEDSIGTATLGTHVAPLAVFPSGVGGPSGDSHARGPL